MTTTYATIPYGGHFSMGPQLTPMPEPMSGFGYCQGVSMPASYMAGGIATYGLGMSYQAHPPIYHYAGFDDSTIDPEEKPFTRVRTTGRRSPPKKRALEATPAPEQEIPEPATKKARTAPPAEDTKSGATSHVATPPSAATHQAVLLPTLRPLPKHLTSFLKVAMAARGRSASKLRSGGASAATTPTPATPTSRPTSSPPPSKAAKTGRPFKTSPLYQGAVAKDAPGQGKPVAITPPANPCQSPATPEQVFKRSRAASPITPLQDSLAEGNPGQGKPAPVTSPTSPCPPPATSEQVFRIRRAASLRSPFQDYIEQEGEPEPSASHPESTMAKLEQGLPAPGSLCPDDTATSPAAPAVTAASQEDTELTENTGNSSASGLRSTVGILEPGPPAPDSSCPDTATSPVSAPAVRAASQGLQEDLEAMDSDGDEDATSREAMVDLLSEDSGAAALAAYPANPPQAANPRLCTRGLWDECTSAMASCPDQRAPSNTRNSPASRRASA